MVIKNTASGIKLAKALAEAGYRVFSTKTARMVGQGFGLNRSYINECLYHLKQSEWVIQLRKGLFALSPILLSGSIINEYEIAMAIVEPASICYLSALHYHQLTQQTPHNVFVLTITNSTKLSASIGKDREITINGIHYNFLSTKKEHYFGIMQIWLGDAQVNITDLERTLLDSITKPKFCGGFAEAIHYFKLALDRVNVEKLIDYANKLGDTAVRRLGWVLDYIGIANSSLVLLRKQFIGHIKLDVSGGNKGKYNSKWGVIENV